MSNLTWARRLWIALWTGLRKILLEIVAPLQMAWVNRRLRKQCSLDPDVDALSDEDLTTFIESEGKRSKDLDEKLQKMIAALSVAVTVGGLAGQAVVGNLAASWLRTATVCAFLLAEIYLVVGVVVGLDGLRPRRRYGYGPAFMRIMAAGGDAKHAELIAAANGSLRDNIVRSNQASAAATAIRNGIVAFMLAVALGLLSAKVLEPANNEAGKVLAGRQKAVADPVIDANLKRVLRSPEALPAELSETMISETPTGS